MINHIYYNKYKYLKTLIQGGIRAMDVKFSLLKESAGTETRLKILTCKKKLMSLELVLGYPSNYPTLTKLKFLIRIEKEIYHIRDTHEI